MEKIAVYPEAKKRLQEFQLPKKLGFGTIFAPIMAMADFKDGQWGPLEFLPYGPLSLDPCAKVFHYAQEIFEGLKAYRRPGERPTLFRPLENFKRFNFSAGRMAMPELPESYFMNAVRGMAHLCKEFIPTESGSSLYLRPFMFATQAHIGIKPSDEYKFLTVASPSESYFTGDSVKVLIQRNYIRAAKGGTGNAKTGGNYAASLLSTRKATERGFQQSLWLDAMEKKYIEELSGMNVAFVENQKILTPKLTESILEGITRKSLFTLAAHLGLTMQEEHLEIQQILENIQEGKCTEAFGMGTAAIVTPIESFHEEDSQKSYALPDKDGEIALVLRENLLSIQEGRKADPFGWIEEVDWSE